MIDWLPHAVIALLLWSTLATAGASLSHVPPFLMLGITLLLGSSLSAFKIRDWYQGLTISAVGVLGIFGYHLCLFLALRLAPPVQANLINYLWPVLMVLLSPLFLKNTKLQLRQILGGALAFSGAIIAISKGDFLKKSFWGQSIQWGENGLGYVMALCAALIWSTYSLLTKKLPHFPTSTVGGFCFAAGVLALGVHRMIEPSYQPTSQEWTTLIYLGIGPMGISFYCWDRALKKGDPKKISSLSYFTPIFSSLFLTLFLGEPTHALIWVSLILITGGAALSLLH